jgi:hypothetical protein
MKLCWKTLFFDALLMCLFVADTTLLAIQVIQRRITEEFDKNTEDAFVSEFNIKPKNFLEVTTTMETVSG